MAGVATPLRRRGAQIEGCFSPRQVGEITAPLTIGPLSSGHELSGLEHELTVPSEHVKGALLISGLYASEPTLVREPIVSHDHTERMLSALEVPMSSAGPIIGLDPSGWNRRLPPFELEVPGDLSAAAFVLTAGMLVPDSRVTTRCTGINPTRVGALDIWRQMGARFEVEVHASSLGEPQAEITAAHSELRSTTIAGEIVVRAVDELPILCALGARARGITLIAGAGAQELRLEASDRLADVIGMLRGFGVEVEGHPDGMSIEGRPEGALRAASVDCHGDPRIAMAAAVLGLLADGPTFIRDVACIRTSFPGFVGTLRALGARIDVVGS
jgi:3-phosphoshikimate 1-carboxyvinyltransferase